MPHCRQYCQVDQLVKLIIGINECCLSRLSFLRQEPCALQFQQGPLPLPISFFREPLQIHLEKSTKFSAASVSIPSNSTVRFLAAPSLVFSDRSSTSSSVSYPPLYASLYPTSTLSLLLYPTSLDSLYIPASRTAQS